MYGTTQYYIYPRITNWRRGQSIHVNTEVHQCTLPFNERAHTAFGVKQTSQTKCVNVNFLHHRCKPEVQDFS